MKRLKSEAGNNLLIVIGVLLMVATVVLHWTLPERFEKVEVLPLIVGGTLAYFGALWKDPDRARKAGDGVTHAGADVVDSVVRLRTGKEQSAPVVEIEKSHPVDDPTAEPTTKVTVVNPGAPSAPKDGAQ